MSRPPLSFPDMLDESTIKRVLNAALKGGGEVAELFVEDRSATSMRLEDSRVENVSSGRDSGAGIRVIAGERASYAYTNLLTEDGLVEAAKTASAGLGGRARFESSTSDGWRLPSSTQSVSGLRTSTRPTR